MDTIRVNEILQYIQKKSPGTEIIAVTKTHPFSVIVDAYKSGFRHFGENRVDELEEKVELARQNNLDGIIWHMVGHVQSRKVHAVVRAADRIDSVDSLELLDKINEEAKMQHKTMNVLLEVNIAGEKSKYGFSPKDVFLSICNFSHVIIDGIMTMPPYVENPEDNRVHFRALRSFSQTIRTQYPIIGPAISMGTSCDWKVAVEEGATEIRLGEAIFGKRT